MIIQPAILAEGFASVAELSIFLTLAENDFRVTRTDNI